MRTLELKISLFSQPLPHFLQPQCLESSSLSHLSPQYWVLHTRQWKLVGKALSLQARAPYPIPCTSLICLGMDFKSSFFLERRDVWPSARALLCSSDISRKGPQCVGRGSRSSVWGLDHSVLWWVISSCCSLIPTFLSDCVFSASEFILLRSMALSFLLQLPSLCIWPHSGGLTGHIIYLASGRSLNRMLSCALVWRQETRLRGFCRGRRERTRRVEGYPAIR